MSADETRPSVPADPKALRVAMQALDLALERHSEAFIARDLLRAYASSAEAVWWICAIDEQLARPSDDAPVWENSDEEPPFEVNADYFGARCVKGLRWVRDCHTHQLPLSTDINVRSYFDPRPGAGQHTSHWVVWKPADQIRSDPKRESRTARRAYTESVGGQESATPLHGASNYLRRRVADLRGSSDSSDAGTE